MRLVACTRTPQWGHGWLTFANGKIYALRSLSSGSALCVLEAPSEPVAEIFTQEQMTVRGEYPTPAAHPCHITILPRQAVTCDYSSGSMSLYELDTAGLPCGEPELIRFVGKGADPERQGKSHPHSSWLSPDGASLVAADLGTDHLYVFKVEDGRIDSSSMIPYAAPAGSGPRHCAFNADGSLLYVATELSDELLTYSFPDMKLLSRALVNEGHPMGGGHVVMSPDGRFLYVSSRLLDDGVAIFSIGTDGIPSLTGYQHCGAHPRHFSLSPDGSMLAVACRDSDKVELYSIDRQSGLLSVMGEYPVQSPAFVTFIQDTND